jgi:polysaccharide export outer membrane protein
VEILALAEGLSADAGDTILLTRQSDGEAGSPQTTEIDIKQLLETGDASLTVLVQPGDVVRVTRAGVVYVIGEVRKPGGFTLRSNEKMTILQALALAEGLERTAAKSRARVIRTDPVSGQRTERTLDLGRVLAGKAEDVRLEPNDILFVPSSAARNALYRGVDAALSIVSGVIIFRR